MTSYNEKDPGASPAKSADQTQTNRNSPPFNRGDKGGSDGDNNDSDQGQDGQVVHQVMPGDVIKADPGKDTNGNKSKSPSPNTAKNDSRPQLHAAKGNDEVMSQPPKKPS